MNIPQKITIWIGPKAYKATVHTVEYRLGAVGTYGEMSLKLSEFIETEDRTPTERDSWWGVIPASERGDAA